MQLHIRDAVPGDASRLAAFAARAFTDSFAAENTPADMVAYVAESFGAGVQALELADPALRYIVAESAGEIVGSARLGFGPAPDRVHGRRPAEIARFYAAKDHIGKGVGRALMQQCLRTAAASGSDVLWLGVWERNFRAIAFYEKWHFQTVGTILFQLGDDAQTDLLMVRDVPPGPG